jgi:uncharacterized protein YkwD
MEGRGIMEFTSRAALAVRDTGRLMLVAVVVLAFAAAGTAQGSSGKARGNAGKAQDAQAGPVAGGCANASAIPSDPASRQVAADAVLCLINNERTQRALAPVTASAQLTRAATAHSADMVRRHYFDHVTPNGVDLRKRVAKTGYLRGARRPSLGETLAWGSDLYASPSELVKDLMSSPAHYAIITDRRYRDIGVGLALGAPMDGMGSGATLALNFGRRS